MRLKPYKVIIRKPLYETDEGYTVGIYDKRIKDAIQARVSMVIETMGVAKMFFPKWIKSNCKTIAKVYLRPDEPMIEYLVFIPKLKKKTKDERLKEFAEAGAFG